jgi:hypothetical protein
VGRFKLQDGLTYHHRNTKNTAKNKAKSKPKKMVESPNTIIQIPNAKMADSNFIPAFFAQGAYRNQHGNKSTNCRTALRKPNPSGPTFRMS